MTVITESDSERELECGHTFTGQATINLAGVGTVCRACHTPYPLERWDQVLQSSKTHHHTGETTTHHTWLIGLDNFGRAIYHDERRNRVLRVVPMHDPVFRDDRTGDENPMREYAPHGRGRLINGPNGRDLLVIVDQSDVDSNAYRKKDLCEWVATNREDIQTLSEKITELLERHANHYDKEYYSDDAFPVEEAHALLEEL